MLKADHEIREHNEDTIQYSRVIKRGKSKGEIQMSNFCKNCGKRMTDPKYEVCYPCAVQMHKRKVPEPEFTNDENKDFFNAGHKSNPRKKQSTEDKIKIFLKKEIKIRVWQILGIAIGSGLAGYMICKGG